MNVSNVIWDFDGTLYDTYGAIVSAFLLVLNKEFGLELEQGRVYALVKIDTKHCAKVLSSEFGLNEANLLKCARRAYDNEITLDQSPYPKVKDVCERISNGSGANYLVTHRDRSSLNKMLLKYDFNKYFKEIVSADDGFAPKPSPESFLYLIAKHNLDPDQTLAIGDRDMDIEAADASGIKSVYLSDFGQLHQNAFLSIKNYDELLDEMGN